MKIWSELKIRKLFSVHEWVSLTDRWNRFTFGQLALEFTKSRTPLAATQPAPATQASTRPLTTSGYSGGWGQFGRFDHPLFASTCDIIQIDRTMSELDFARSTLNDEC